MFKKVIVLLATVTLMVSLGGCGAKEKISEKVAEEVAEGVINQAGDGETEVDLDGDKLTVEGADGEVVTIGATEWPKGMAADLLPELKMGKVISAMNSEEACSIILQEIEEQDYQEYLSTLKEKGYTNNASELSNDDVLWYYADSDEKTSVAVSYSNKSKEMSISLQKTT